MASASTAAQPAVRARGIGLSNVNERLRVIYGAKYRLQLHERPGPGHAGAARDPRAGRCRSGVSA